MASKAFPLLAAGAAVLLLSGKKKKKKASTSDSTDDLPNDGDGGGDGDGGDGDGGDEGDEGDEGEVDEGDGPNEDEAEYGKVASGVRNDRRGAHPWRIMREEDGFHAQTMAGPGKFAAMQEEIGVAASLKAAKELLRDHYNQLILDSGYSEDDLLEDPAKARTITRLQMA